jgi:hypothetical protein
MTESQARRECHHSQRSTHIGVSSAAGFDAWFEKPRSFLRGFFPDGFVLFFGA